jgi:peptide/nickel transport system permease protein
MSTAYIIRRLFGALLVLFIVVTLNFLIPRTLPGNPAERFYADPRVSPENKAIILQQFGLDQPLHIQYLRYLAQLSRGDLGVSFNYRRPVLDVIAERIPKTLLLTLSAMVLSLILGVSLGAYMGWKRGSWLDTGILSASLILRALPSFWLAMILLLIFGYYLDFFPLQGGIADPGLTPGLNAPYILSVIRHATLPIFTMTLAATIGYAVLVRSSMIETLGKDYIVTARSKGLTQRRILFIHVLRNALLPLVTNIGMRLSGLLGGVVVIEMVFSWQGMGLLILEASRAMDYPLMQGAFLLLAIITIASNFLTDMMYVFVDPRIKFT